MILHFKTNVLLKDTLGQNLINNDNLAVLELVKNSFDAKAKEVTVIFKYLTDKTKDLFASDTPVSTLIIKDTGVGMSMSDIENKWLNIAYSEKKNKSDINTQVFAGDKGVGRFSCDRLGTKLNLYTKKNESNNIIHLCVNWSDFEKSDMYATIEKVDVVVNEIDAAELVQRGYEIGQQGTIIEMTDLRSNWDKKKIKDLKNNYLAKLINPNQIYLKKEKKIILKLEVSDFPELNGTIDNKVFENLNYRTTSVEAFTSYDEKNKKLILTTILRHKGKDILKITEENNRFIELKDVKIVCFYLNPYAKSRFLKEQGIRSIDYGSIFLFLNGFRVSPYGDKGNDWLGLEQRKGQGQKRYLGTREIVGRIEITDFEGVFRPVSSREGLVKNDVFNLLTKTKTNEEDIIIEQKGYGLFLETLRSLERYVVDGLKWDSYISPEYLREFEDRLQRGEKVEELYAETDSEKDKRCLDALQSIIQNRSGEILSLQIDNDFVLQLLDNEEEKNKLFLKNLEKYTGKLTRDTYNVFEDIKEALKEKDRKLEEQRKQLLEEEQRRITAEQKVINEAKKRQQAEEKSKEEEQRRIEAEQKQKKAEDESKQIAENLAIEQKKNTYLLATTRTNEDADGLIHHIAILNGSAQSTIDDLIKTIQSNSNIEIDYIISELLRVLLNINKTMTIATLITRAAFKKDEDKQNISISDYIAQYLITYKQIVGNPEIQLLFIETAHKIYRYISPLELSIIVDNLVSNARKWKAKKIVFEVIDGDKNEILIYDDGQGLSSKLLNNPQQIFQLGITESNGSGIGLYFVKDILNKKMNADIEFVGNNITLKGACFKITFK